MDIENILSADLRKELIDHQKGLDYGKITAAKDLYPPRVADTLTSKGIELEGLVDRRV